MTTFTLIVPTIAESNATGFVGGMEKNYRGTVYRGEIYAAGWHFLKDGEPLRLRSFDDLPKPVQKAAIDAKRMLAEAAALRAA